MELAISPFASPLGEGGSERKRGAGWDVQRPHPAANRIGAADFGYDIGQVGNIRLGRRPPSRKGEGSHLARDEAAPDLFLRQSAADEYDPALPLLILLPGALVVAVQDHVNTLEHEALRIVLER